MFKGKVITGDGIGKELGYPTANLDTSKKEIKVGTGVYAARALCRGREYPAALILQDEPWKVEVHLLEYDGADCYGAVMEVNPVQKVSELEHFEDQVELKEKIATDIEAVKRVLKVG